MQRMPIALDQLPDDVDALKALVADQQQSSTTLRLAMSSCSPKSLASMNN